MSTIEDKSKVLEISLVARRIQRELQYMKKQGIFNTDNDVDIINYDTIGKEFDVIIKDTTNFVYKFHIPRNYPFNSPKLILNSKPYSHYFKFKSDLFREKFYKYRTQDCFCCESILCCNNWGPHLNMNNIINEVKSLHTDCRKIVDTVIVEVIKRKYLIDDVNILEWLY
jgi:ubiquitin-protein ligase